MSEHTPLPWKIETYRVDTGRAFDFVSSNHNPFICEGETADLEFIVRACNNYEEAIAALEVSKSAFIAMLDSGFLLDREARRLARSQLDYIDAVLAKGRK